MIMALISTLN
jgi:dynein heavy chain 1, cytosolic